LKKRRRGRKKLGGFQKEHAISRKKRPKQASLIVFPRTTLGQFKRQNCELETALQFCQSKKADIQAGVILVTGRNY
jgi:hypothetical protein